MVVNKEADRTFVYASQANTSIYSMKSKWYKHVTIKYRIYANKCQKL